MKHASQNNSLDIIELLLSHGAGISEEYSESGSYNLICVCSIGRVNIFVDFMLAKGANIHQQGVSPHEPSDGGSCFSTALHSNHIRVLYRLRKWTTTMAIIMLQELALIYIIDSESVIDLHQYLGRPEDLKTDNEEDCTKDEEGNVL